MKVQVETPSRLHFILIDLNGELGRVDGGVGVALQTPGWRIEVEPSAEGLEVEGCPEAGFEEVQNLALKFLGSQGVKPSLKIKVSGGIPRHVGLGSGTQLALGVAKALAEALNLKLPVRTLARLMGRGGTSGIGVAAFEAGGIIVDGGHSFGPGRQKQDFLPSHYAEAPPPPVLARFYPPEDWRWVVVVPPMRGAHGLREAEFFREQCPIPASEVAKASRIVLMKLMPALAEADVEAAGEALNMLQEVGFKRLEVQLAGSLPKKLMQHLVDQGAYGAGLSSFGPAIYALTTGEKAAENLSKAAQELLDRAGVSGLIYKSKTNVGGAKILKI